MKFVLLLLSLLLVSCGSLRVAPHGCKSQGLWGEEAEAGKETAEEHVSFDYNVFFDDVEVKLKDILADAGIQCSSLKRVRVEFESQFFIRRKLHVYVQK